MPNSTNQRNVLNPLDRPAISLTRMASWLLVARMASFAVGIILPLVLIRLLTPHNFGLYKQVFLVVNSSVMYLSLGVGMSAFYFLVRDPERRRETMLNILVFLFTAGSLGALVLTLWPASFVFLSREPETAAYAPWVGVLIVLSIVGAFFEIAPIANREIPVATAVILGSQTSRTVLLLGAALLFGTIQSLVWAAILQGVLQVTGLLLYVSKRFPHFWRHFDLSLLGAQLSYAIPLGLANMLWSLQNDLHNYFVSNWFGAVGFAVYSTGCFQLPLINMLHESAASVLIPQIAQLQKHGQSEEIIGLTLRAMRKISMLAFAAYAYLLVMGYEVIRVLFTDQYISSWPLFLVNITLIPLSVILTDPIVRACADLRHRLLQIQCVLFLLLIAALWWATSRFGMLGAISSTVGMVVVYRLCVLWLYGRALRVGIRHLPQLKSLGKLALSAALAAMVTAAVRLLILQWAPILILGICGGVFMLFYAALLYQWGIATPDELAYVRTRVRKSLVWLRSVMGLTQN